MSENYEREKSPYYLQFQKLYDSTWVVTTDFCSMNLVKREANKTPTDTFFIYDSFYDASCRENLNDIKYPVLFVQDCCDLISQPFVKVSFRVVDVLEAPKKALTQHYAFIFAYCELQGVSFQKFVLPHADIVKPLYTFLKGGYIPEVLLINTNPNNQGNDVLIVAGVKKQKKATVGALAEPCTWT